MDFFYVFFKIHTKSGAQIGDFRTGGCHPLLKIDGWHATRATRSNEGPALKSFTFATFKGLIFQKHFQRVESDFYPQLICDYKNYNEHAS